MKSAMLTLTLTTAALLGSAAVLLAQGYGGAVYTPASYYTDPRNVKEALDASETMQRYARSTTALFSDRVLILDEAAGVYKMNNLSLKEKYNLQEGEPFAGQTVGAYCSGALVGEDLVLTSGHCFKPDERGGPCERVKFVFGYSVGANGAMPSSFPAADVYSCQQIVRSRVQDVEDDDPGKGHNFGCLNNNCRTAPLAGNGPDYALVRLDRKVAGRQPLPINRSAIAQGAAVGVIGYPSGMPVKVQEEEAEVRTVTRSGYFVTNLNTFKGNSGSPVFNMETLKIEGVLARGGVDFVYEAGGVTVNDSPTPYGYAPGKAKRYTRDTGRGEDVTLITAVQDLIPVSPAEKYLDSMQQAAAPQGQPQFVPAVYFPGQNNGGNQPAGDLPEPQFLSI